MGKGAVIGSVITGILGVIILVFTIQDWQADEAHFSAEKQRLNAELNVATNNIVSACLSSLPAGDPHCDSLRANVAESCQLVDDELDACKDGRVEQYFIGLQAEQPAEPASQPLEDKTIEQTQYKRELALTVLKAYRECAVQDYRYYSDESKANCNEQMNIASTYCEQYHFEICDPQKHQEFGQIVTVAKSEEGRITGIWGAYDSTFLTFTVQSWTNGQNMSGPADGKLNVKLFQEADPYTCNADCDVSKLLHETNYEIRADDPIVNEPMYRYYQFPIDTTNVPWSNFGQKVILFTFTSVDGEVFTYTDRPRWS